MVLGYSKLIGYWQKVKALGFKRSIKTLHHRFQIKNEIESVRHYPSDLFSISNRHLSYVQDLSCMQEKMPKKIIWHCDPTLSTHNHAFCFDPSKYYQQIKIDAHQGKDRGPDIRNLWQIGRCYDLPLVAAQYHCTHEEKYLNSIKMQIGSFLDANSYLYGPHWFNGMEVGLRAINWVCTVQYLHEVLQKDTPFYNRLLKSLYDHMHYLEHNWEWYDGRTNNHYLSNVVGYAYLLWFFQDLHGMEDKWHWCYQELLNELEWQIFDEGTSYEGSTAYHQFVLELFLHAFLITQKMGEIIPDQVRDKLQRMINFIQLLKSSENDQIVKIGDDDSSMVTKLISIQKLAESLQICVNVKDGIVDYPKFGLSIKRFEKWHVTIRHASYTHRQPTAHFHQDIGSITISYDGIPLVVDPGTYTYTGSVYWRNYFRSSLSHNSVSTLNESMPSDLFSLPRIEVDGQFFKQDEDLRSYFSLGNAAVDRTVTVCQQRVLIRDMYHGPPQELLWIFVFHPDIEVVQHQTGWRIVCPNGNRFSIRSTYPLSLKPAYYSQSYAEIRSTWRLHAHHKMHDGDAAEMQLSLC